MPARRFLTCLAFTTLAASWTDPPRASFAQQSSSKPDPKLQILREVGANYAQQAEGSLANVQLTLVGKVTNDSATWATRLTEALVVGYAPEPGVFAAIPFADVKPFMKVRMGGGRSPEETVKHVVRLGNIVTKVTWYFAGVDPVKGYAVFSPHDELLFDTLLSLPLVRGRVLGTGH